MRKFEIFRISSWNFRFFSNLYAGDRGASQLQRTPPLRPSAQHVLSLPCVFFAMGGAETEFQRPLVDFEA